VNPGSFDIASGGRFQFIAQGGDPVGETYTWSLPDGGGELESGQYQWQKSLRAGPVGGRYRLLLSTSGGDTTAVRAEVTAYGGERLYAAEFPLRYVWK